MTAPDEVVALIARFRSHLASYKSSAYPEAQVRREFIDPMFRALGWDIDNEQGFAEAYKDVIHEDSIRTAQGTKAPDYCFRVGGTRKFFVEAKRPSVNVKDDPHPAYQLRRYGWSSALSLSILTDFDEFAVYDCRHEPKLGDQASTARVLYMRFEEYEERWAEIASLFTKNSVLTGAYDRYAESSKAKRGTTTVDQSFLEEIEGWRKELARNFALRNSGISRAELNFAVQRTIDRIIFLRICEGRGIEPYGQLRALAEPKQHDLYPALCALFMRADDKYNSGIFHFKQESTRSAPDELTVGLTLDDKVIRQVLSKLYYPDSPYEFSVLPADILGQVYERFLGQAIRLTEKGRAVIEPKPEVRKAGGVYYTPTYIVEFIIARTLTPILETLTTRSSARLKVLDPASGSGSFLIAAYDHLLAWHLDQYLTRRSKADMNRVYQAGNGEYRLTIEEKKRILLDNIFGVDIDPQAVEVTKLSLLLKVLEGESESSVHHQWRLFHERALPDLHTNIKCGDSLIAPDYFNDPGTLALDQNEQLIRNPLSWESEFPDVFAAGGFDVVIGNPPYVFTRENFSERERNYYETRYKAGWEKRNTFQLFMELMLRLLSDKGRGGFIVPNSWMTIESSNLLRELYAGRIRELADLNYEVFPGVSVEPCIYIASGKPKKDSVKVSRSYSREEFMTPNTIEISEELWRDSGGRLVIPEDPRQRAIVDSILGNSVEMGKRFDVRTGLQAYERGKGTPKQTKEDVKNHIYDRDARVDENSYRYLQGRDVKRYEIDWSGMWMQYGPWLSQPREIEIFVRPRVLLREITSPLPYCMSAVFTDEAYLSNKSVLTVLEEDDDEQQLKLLEAILNCRLTSLFYKARAVKSARKVFPKVVIRNLREFPFPAKIVAGQRERVLQIRKSICECQERIARAKTPFDREPLDRQMKSLQDALDGAVGSLFGLNPSEQAILLDLTKQPK